MPSPRPRGKSDSRPVRVEIMVVINVSTGVSKSLTGSGVESKASGSRQRRMYAVGKSGIRSVTERHRGGMKK